MASITRSRGGNWIAYRGDRARIFSTWLRAAAWRLHLA